MLSMYSLAIDIRSSDLRVEGLKVLRNYIEMYIFTNVVLSICFWFMNKVVVTLYLFLFTCR